MLLQRPAAMALKLAAERLKDKGIGLIVHDAYRPWFITRLMWDITPESKREFVANPQKGSRHNRGCAVDVSLYSLSDGAVLPMPSEYDEFSERAAPDYAGGRLEERINRDHLRQAMESSGFTVNSDEWWHFDFRDWPLYAIQNIDNGIMNSY